MECADDDASLPIRVSPQDGMRIVMVAEDQPFRRTLIHSEHFKKRGRLTDHTVQS
jgi:hypothetical protein